MGGVNLYRAKNVNSLFQIAEHFDLPFLEVSCKDNINIEACFMCLARKIREKREQKVGF